MVWAHSSRATAVLCFYVTTWETYHTHTMFLGYINGPVDGTVGLTVCFFFTGYYGRAMWDFPVHWVEVFNIPGTPWDGFFSHWRVCDVGYTVFTVFSVCTVLARSAIPRFLRWESPDPARWKTTPNRFSRH